MNPLKRHTLLLLLPLLAALVQCSKNGNVVTPTYRPLTEAVYASGTVRPQNEYKVYALAEGYLTDKLVDINSPVKPGSILFKIEAIEQSARYKAADEVYRQALLNYREDSPILTELKAAMQNAREKLTTDSTNYVRYQNLWANNAVSRMEYDRNELTYKTSQNDYRAARDRYQRTRSQLRVDLENAESNYKVNRNQESNYMVRSSIEGIVYEIYKERGEAVRKNDALALLGDGRDVYLNLSIDELDIARVKPGQEVLVKVDSYKDRVFKARISKIYPMLNKQEQTFRVDAEFAEKLPDVFAGLNVEANILTLQKDKALTIPRMALVGKDSVRVLQNGKPQYVRIQKGAENFEWVEVTQGLDSNSQVLVNQ